MTDEEMRIAIAEACGWTKIRMTIKGAGAPERGPSPHGYPPGRKYEAPLPNYLGCLNAMHEAEKVLTLQQMEKYTGLLCDMVASGDPDPNIEGLICLTARQRAEAFCRTLFPERFK